MQKTLNVLLASLVVFPSVFLGVHLIRKIDAHFQLVREFNEYERELKKTSWIRLSFQDLFLCRDQLPKPEPISLGLVKTYFRTEDLYDYLDCAKQEVITGSWLFGGHLCFAFRHDDNPQQDSFTVCSFIRQIHRNVGWHYIMLSILVLAVTLPFKLLTIMMDRNDSSPQNNVYCQGTQNDRTMLAKFRPTAINSGHHVPAQSFSSPQIQHYKRQLNRLRTVAVPFDKLGLTADVSRRTSKSRLPLGEKLRQGATHLISLAGSSTDQYSDHSFTSDEVIYTGLSHDMDETVQTKYSLRCTNDHDNVESCPDEYLQKSNISSYGDRKTIEKDNSAEKYLSDSERIYCFGQRKSRQRRRWKKIRNKSRNKELVENWGIDKNTFHTTSSSETIDKATERMITMEEKDKMKALEFIAKVKSSCKFKDGQSKAKQKTKKKVKHNTKSSVSNAQLSEEPLSEAAIVWDSKKSHLLEMNHLLSTVPASKASKHYGKNSAMILAGTKAAKQKLLFKNRHSREQQFIPDYSSLGMQRTESNNNHNHVIRRSSYQSMANESNGGPGRGARDIVRAESMKRDCNMQRFPSDQRTLKEKNKMVSGKRHCYFEIPVNEWNMKRRNSSHHAPVGERKLEINTEYAESKSGDEGTIKTRNSSENTTDYMGDKRGKINDFRDFKGKYGLQPTKKKTSRKRSPRSKVKAKQILDSTVNEYDGEDDDVTWNHEPERADMFPVTTRDSSTDCKMKERDWCQCIKKQSKGVESIRWSRLEHNKLPDCAMEKIQPYRIVGNEFIGTFKSLPLRLV